LDAYLLKFPQYDRLIAIKPSGWTHTDAPGVCQLSKGVIISKKSKNITIYGLEYSEHSSFDELKNCIQTLRPEKIIPTVNVAKKESRDLMQSYFNEWMANRK
jgi:DNA cross-link repair 1A protein